MLAEVGQGLKSLVREVDSVFRYGGDEFIVLLPETDKAGAQKTAEHLLGELRGMRFAIEHGLSLPVRASFGAATYPEDGLSVHEVIRAADTMMYLVKGSTRDNVAVAGMGMVQREIDRPQGAA